MERREEQRRIDVALVVGAVDGGLIERQVLPAGDAISDPAQAEPQANTSVTQQVEHVLPAKEDGQGHARRGDKDDVKGDGYKGRNRSQRRDEHERVSYDTLAARRGATTWARGGATLATLARAVATVRGESFFAGALGLFVSTIAVPAYGDTFSGVPSCG